MMSIVWLVVTMLALWSSMVLATQAVVNGTRIPWWQFAAVAALVLSVALHNNWIRL